VSLKIGLLLDSMVVPVWQQHIIRYIKSNSLFSIQLIVLNSARKTSGGHRVYRFFRKTDRMLFATRHDCFRRVSLDEVLKGIEVMPVTPVCKTFTDQIATQDTDIIMARNLDVIIRFGFRILKGDILHAARYGVWSLHHGDNAVNRGGPPAFWEVVHKEPVTGVTLQVLSSDLDGGAVIDKAFVKTDQTSFNRNQNALYWAGIELFCSALTRLSQNKLSPSSQGEQPGAFYCNPLYRDPGNVKALLIFLSFWIRRLTEAARSFFRKPRWSLYFKFSKASVETSLYRYKKLTPPPGTDWADPFVVHKDQQYYVFFEELLHKRKNAHISCLVFNDQGKRISGAPVKVLEEAHHLSYPFIFEHQRQYFMLPEAASCQSVWLYRCTQFPDKWEKHIELLKGVAMFDPTLIFHQGLWYLLGTQKPYEGNSPDQYLYIYYSDSLDGEWKAHARNPVTRDVRGARPAGRLFYRDGKLIRPSQIGAPKYGYGMRFHEVLKLSPEEFEERTLDDILPYWKKDLLATHTFNSVDGFTVVDVQE